MAFQQRPQDHMVKWYVEDPYSPYKVCSFYLRFIKVPEAASGTRLNKAHFLNPDEQVPLFYLRLYL